MTRYRKKPVVIDAVQWLGNNQTDIKEFAGKFILGSLSPWQPFEVGTLEGKHIASVGDFIIRSVAGEFYPCEPEIFEATYEEVFPECSK